MIRIATRLSIIIVSAATLSLAAPGCGEGLEDVPANAPYVAPPPPGDMKPAPKSKRRPQTGVPLGFHAPRIDPAV